MSRIGRSALGGALLSLAGCDATRTLQALPVDATARSVILVALTEPEPRLYASDLGANGQVSVLNAADDDVVLALVYDLSLAELGLSDVAIVPGLAADPPLPPERSAYRLITDNGSWGPVESDVLGQAHAIHLHIGTLHCMCFAVATADSFRCAVCQPPVRLADPTPPALPAAPEMGPCPPGWQLQGPSEDEQSCEPPPFVPCPLGKAQFVGSSTCSTLGNDCPVAGELYAQAPDPKRYVDASAAAGGMGTAQSPFRTLLEAMNSATPGTTVLLAKGQHSQGAAALTEGVTVLGACVRQTTLALGAPLQIDGQAVRIKNLSFVGAGVQVPPSSMVSIEDVSFVGVDRALQSDGPSELLRVVVDGSAGPAIVARGPSFEATELNVFDAPKAVEGGIGTNAVIRGLWGRQITVEAVSTDGGRLQFERSKLDDVAAGVRAGPGSLLTLAQVSLRANGRGVSTIGAQVELHQVALLGAMADNLFALGSTLSASDLIASDSTAGSGARLSGGGAFDFERVLFARNKLSGADLANLGTAGLHDVRCRGVTQPAPEGEGLIVSGVGPLRVERVLLEDHVSNALQIDRPGEIADVTVRRVIREDSGLGGLSLPAAGLSLLPGSGGSAERIAIEGVEGSGVAHGGSDAMPCQPKEQTLSDVWVRHSQQGVSIQCGGLFMHDVRVDAASNEGVELGNLKAVALARAERVQITDSAHNPSNAAVLVHSGELELSQALITGSGRAVLIRSVARLHPRAVDIHDNMVGVSLPVDYAFIDDLADLALGPNETQVRSGN